MAIKFKIPDIIKRYSFNGYLSAILFLLLTIIGITRALQQYYIIDASKTLQHSLFWHIPFNLFFWWLWFLFVPVIYWIMIKFSKMPWIVEYFLFPVVIILARQSLASIILTIRGTSTFYEFLNYRMLKGPGIWVDIVVFFSIMIAIRVVEYKKKYELDNLKYSQLLSRLTQSQLNALKSQLCPHFLFNTLNSLSTSIILRENSEAKKMIALIKDFLKTTIEENEQQEIPFEQELKFIKQYLDIQKVRFEDKLKVIKQIDTDTLSAYVPSYLLLPLVENSMNYAIAPKKSGGIISISSVRKNGQIVIVIEDNGPGLRDGNVNGKLKEGIGIKITRERLYHLYKGKYDLKFETGSLGGMRVTIRIPYSRISIEVPSIDTYAENF